MNYILLKELMKQSETECGFDSNKFAELIVKECAEIALLDGQATGNFETFNKITKHFGVEYEDESKAP
jgi:hypothetical protein